MGYSKFVEVTMLGADSISRECNGTVADCPAVYSGHGCSYLDDIYL
jgi:hypothetical protein